ncbi:DNA segregation ATPase FtsK/SpoIIIE and related protein [Pedobacter heparinus DSM 2366]|uniref:DNA segregation ATPase FtsK/SpoIIIE and related protein n=1 Tax=Pedobacter heparinus (strain ATCC 13125 / DSM 2366 / CIP 104194 / JCM 7457 / NBRC 12017 / NCIMB 9290 / NRRL B-14731 / HIM 762-3) TaxID=485917 RepID=C6XT07_PEDHD|nr:DNA segregation ATPase FtsK/SpoIIIE and related protein [Pedobacter heparinus DSM 2366]
MLEDKIKARLDEIAATLIPFVDAKDIGLSLFSGKLGLSLFLAYYARFKKSEADMDSAVQIVEHVFDPNELDSMFEDAARIIGIHQQGSTSLIQRKLKLGYNRAGRIIDQLKAIGIVGPFDGSKAREVLIPDDYALELFLNALRLEDGGEVAGTGVKVAVSENVVEREGNNGWSKIRSWFGY